MVLGAIWCPLDKTREISKRLREIKNKHNLPSNFEIKWSKVSPGKLDFYLDAIDYFFDDDDLHFRALIIPDKTKLNHAAFDDQDHDTWYYKMYFDMLKVIFDPEERYRIYLDIKDTQGSRKVRKLHEILSGSMYDFSQTVIERMQLVHSHEVEQLQLADLLIGAVGYVNRNLQGSNAKLELINRIKERSNYTLSKTTFLKENKMNIFVWRATEIQG